MFRWHRRCSWSIQLINLHNSCPFLLQGPTGSTSVRYSLFLSQKAGCSTTFCIVIAALTRMYNHLVLSLADRYELCRLRASREDAFREGNEKRKDIQPVH